MGKQGRRQKADFRAGKGQPIVSLGLTGSLASGKSTSLKAFKKLGWKVLSSDVIVAKIYKKRGLSKKALRKQALHPKTLRKLEKWVHPLVKKKVLKMIAKSKKNVVVEVPLLFESGFDRIFDKTLYIDCPTAIRKQRAMKRGMSPALFKFLESKQWSPAKKQASSDFVIKNRSKSSLLKSVKMLSKKLSSLK